MVILAWHVHHDRLYEPLTEPIEVRREYIQKRKPEAERAIRLRLLKVVVGPVSAVLDDLWRAFEATWRAPDDSWRVGDVVPSLVVPALGCAVLAFSDAWRVHESEMLALHAVECPDCPWDGETIFPERLTR